MADDTEIIDDTDDDLPFQTEEREEELSRVKSIRDTLLQHYKDVEKGFSDQWERSNTQMDYWDIYHCVLGPKQFYSGNSKIFVPIIHDAINARKTRFVNQIFPQTGKHVDVIASEDKPLGLMSLLEFYIRKAKLRTRVMPALVRNGDVEGHFNIYMKWIRNERHVAMRVKKRLQIGDDEEMDADDDEDDIVEMVDVHQYPSLEVLPDCDVLVMPTTADSVDGAIDVGGSATVIRRWSKAKIQQLIDDGEIDEAAGETLIEGMSDKTSSDTPNKKKIVTDAAGIKVEGGKTFALVYESWKKIEVDGEMRLCRAFLGGEDRVIGCKLNPYWCDKVPLLSAPVEKIEGSFKGVPKVKFVETMQYAANDAANEGADASAYALLPIVMTDPERNPRVGSMVLNVAAVWETDPKSTQFAKFPDLWKDAATIVTGYKEQIFQTLGINPAMMPQQTMAPGKKPNQAMIANEQQVDILTTADSVTVIEEEILSPALQWFVWLDHQFRDKDLLVPRFGRVGRKMEMEEVPPIQMGKRFEFRWFGVEAARSLQQMQMQMAGLNVIKGIPPQAYQGYKLNLAPLIQHWVDNIFGPRLGGEIFTDMRSELTIEVEQENQMLEQGLDLLVHPLDNDNEHMQAHAQAMQAIGDDPYGVFRIHLQRHQQQMQVKQQAQLMQQAGMQGGGPPQQGQQGQGRGPRQGANSSGPRNQGPPGMIAQDQLTNAMPRQQRGGGRIAQ
jgi:hypothetical protein